MRKTILEEAVEDVQALKRAAEENAKNLLVEAMSPKLKEFISNHLGQEGLQNAMAIDSAMDAGQNGIEQVPGQHSGIAEMDFDIDGMDTDSDDDDSDEEMFGKKDHCPVDGDEEDSEDGEDDTDGDIELNIKKEASEEMDENTENEVQEGAENDEVDESVEITSEDLRKAFEEVLSHGLREAGGAAKFGDMEDPNEGDTGLIPKAPGEVQWADGAKVIKKAKAVSPKKTEARDVVGENQALRQKLAQYAEAFKYLKKNLNEMNLFNAKLIYTTKLMQNNLSDKQKMNVVESIDRAKTKNEVELVYNTLSESLKIAGVLGESKVKGPKASRFMKPGSTVIQESAQRPAGEVSRWAELAGICE